MTTEPLWYSTVTGTGLNQGDLIHGCPVPTVGSVQFPIKNDDPALITVTSHDVVVLTQTCDLVNDKVEDILLGLVLAYSEVVPEGATVRERKSFRTKLVKDLEPRYSLLHRREGEAPDLPWSVVDFHHLYAVPKAYIEAFVATKDHRVRLLPPYREHLAQAFARYFMRVGLPHEAHPFIENEDAPGVP